MPRNVLSIHMSIFNKIFNKAKTAEEVADRVVHEVVKDAWIHMRDGQFKQWMEVDAMSEDDKAGLGIELELAGLAYAYVLLETLEQNMEHPITQESFRSVRNGLLTAFTKHVRRGQTGGELHEQLVQVTAMRCKELRNGQQRHKAELNTKDLKRNFWSAICAENTLNHLVGNVPPQDINKEDLFDHLARWNMRLGNNIQRALLDGGKVTMPSK